MLFTFLGGIFDGYCNFLKWLVKMATKRFIFDLGSVYYTQRGVVYVTGVTKHFR